METSSEPVRMMNDKLKAYRKKRDLSKSGEPAESGQHTGKRRFVIQKHDASSLHYDFRLEFGGVLVSWAVPKGFSTDPSDKRLAIRTEDHPLGYIDFEGTIPKGEYGGGTVMVWDSGSYDNLLAHKGPNSKGMDKALKEGLIEVWLNGEKIRGGYALKRTGKGDNERWLLIKMNDDEADARRNPTSTQTKSVKSGRDLDEIASDEGQSDE